MRTLTLSVWFQLPLGRSTYLLFNTDIVNFVWKTDDGEAESIVLLFLFFGGAWIFGGWGVVEWGRKSYLGPTEIVSFSSQSFSHLNQIWFKCETPLLFFLIIFYYIEKQSPTYVLQNRYPSGLQLYWKETAKQVFFSCEICKILRTPFLKNTSGGYFCTYVHTWRHM